MATDGAAKLGRDQYYLEEQTAEGIVGHAEVCVTFFYPCPSKGGP